MGPDAMEIMFTHVNLKSSEETIKLQLSSINER